MDHGSFLEKHMDKLSVLACKSGLTAKSPSIMSLMHNAMLVGHMRLSMEEITIVGNKVDMLLKLTTHSKLILGEPPSACYLVMAPEN
jgi:hypothetical protein